MLETVLFAVLLLAGVPIVFVFGLVSLFYGLRVGDIDFFIFPQQMFIGVNKFVLMSIPFFILAGNLMNKGGITRRLVELALALLGFVRGGLALSSVLAGIMFSELTGSAQASAAAIGSVMIPSMKGRGYDPAFSSAVVSATAVLAPIIPPSVSMIIYGAAGEVSIGALFAAGIVPGLIGGICLMLATYRYAVRGSFPKEQPFAVRRLLRALRESALALMAPVVILGGIWGGVFTPTEAAAVAVGYSLVVGLLVYRELKLRELPKILLDTAVLATSIMFIMGAATILAWVLTYAEVPDMVAHAAAGLQDPYLFLLIVNLLVLFVGMWMDPTATIVVLTPILLPIAVSLGVHPVHFGVVFVYNLMIGMVTPPVGYVLYITSAIGDVSIERIVRVLSPFLILHVAVLLFITYAPWVVMIVPQILGYR